MDFGLDIHLIIHPRTNPAWVEKAVGSVMKAQEQSRMPTALHIVPAIIGHIGKARRRGYSLGKYSYVTSVDDDDWVDDTAFRILAHHMAKGVAGITTGFYVELPNRTRMRAKARDNLKVLRRDVAQSSSLEDWPVFESWHLLHHMDTQGEVVELPNPVYHYRQGYESNNVNILKRQYQPAMQERIDALRPFKPLALKDERPVVA